MTKKIWTIAAVAAVAAVAAALLAGAGYGLYQLGQLRGAAANASIPAAATSSADPQSSIAAGEAATRRHIKDRLKAGDIDPANGEKIIYYQDPMVPGKRFDAPAKSPFMDMMLVPVYGGAGGSADGSNITVSPRVQQNLGLRTAEVVNGVIASQLQAIGNIAWNERDQSVIQPRAAGFIERLYVRASFDAVRAGQPFADVYVPEWIAAQQEFLAVIKAAAGDTALIAAARQRLLLLGMSEAQVARVATSGSSRWSRTRSTRTAVSSGSKPNLGPISATSTMPTSVWSPGRPLPMSCSRAPNNNRSGRSTRSARAAALAQVSSRCRSTVKRW